MELRAIDVRSAQLISASAFGLLLAALLTGCGFVHDEVLTGPYRLVATDVPEQMSICRTIGVGDCIGRIPETVFSVGWNESYIVAKQHPRNNRTVTNYFILEMALDSELADPHKSVTGPLSATEFDVKRGKLALPPFTKTIETLQ